MEDDDELWAKLRDVCKETVQDLIINNDTPRGHISSFNDFLDNIVPTIKELHIVTALRGDTRCTLQLCNPRLESPRIVEGGSTVPVMLLPSDCRIRNLTYAASLYVDVVIREYKWPEGEILARRRPVDGTVRYSNPQVYADPLASERLKFSATACPQSHSAPDVLNAQDPGRLTHIRTERNVFLARIPIATRSALCHLDHGHTDVKTRSEIGGIFIVSGMEKILPPMGRLAHNWPFVFRDPKDLARLEIRCSPYARRFCATATLSMVLTHAPTQGTAMSQDIMVKLPFVSKPVPVAVLAYALGWNLISFSCLVGSMMGSTQVPELDFKLRTLFAGMPSNCNQDMALVMLANCSSANARHVGATMRSAAGEVPKHNHHQSSATATATTAAAVDGGDQSNAGQSTTDATLSLIRFGQHTLRHSLFPHLPWDTDKKAFLLARCVWKLLACTSKPAVMDFDDRDLHKRYESCGTLWTSLFRQVLTNYLDTVSRLLPKTYMVNRNVPITKIIDGEFPSTQFEYCVKTGIWCPNKSTVNNRRNVSQLVANASEAARVAHYTRLSTSVNSEARDTGPRQVRGANFGKIDPSLTPEDRQCGLTVHQAYGTRMSLGCDPAILTRILERAGKHLILPFAKWQDEFLKVFDGSGPPQNLTEIACGFGNAFATKSAVFVETNMVGWTTDPHALASLIRTMRRKCAIAPDVGVTVKPAPENCVCLRTCAGRILGPLLRIDKSTHAFWMDPERKLRSLFDLEAAGMVEYLDNDEMVNCVTATSAESAVHRLKQSTTRAKALNITHKNWEFTHLMIDHALIFSLAAARIPFANHNAATRVTYSAAMYSQGIDARMNANEIQSKKHTLLYPQKQLVKSKFVGVAGGSLEPCGQLLKLLVYDMGENQNDAFIVKRSTVERGACTSMVEKWYREETKARSQRDSFQRPDPSVTAHVKFSRTDHLDPQTGLPRVGSVTRDGDVVIGKVEQIKPMSATAQYRASALGAGAGNNGLGLNMLDSSTVHRGEPMVVSRTLRTRGQNGNIIQKVELRGINVLLEGDKITSLVPHTRTHPRTHPPTPTHTLTPTQTFFTCSMARKALCGSLTTKTCPFL